MRLATWNLDRCPPGPSGRATTLLEMMSVIDADVWVLTETNRAFSPGPGYSLAAHSADAPDRCAERGECWVAIWSRLSAEPVPLKADLERVAAARVLGGTVVGTVLPWLADMRDPVLRGEAAFRARLREQAEDWTRLRAEGGLCVAGDFNQDLLDAGHYYGSTGGRRALRETLASASLECITSGIGDPLAAIPGSASIDHICIGGFTAAGSPRSAAWPLDKLPKGLTDHHGVWAVLCPG